MKTCNILFVVFISTSVIMIMSSSVLRLTCQLSGDHTVAVCLHCGQEVRRGKVGSPKKDCGNRGMQQHVERIHKENIPALQEARARLASEAAGRKYDPKGGGNKK